MIIFLVIIKKTTWYFKNNNKYFYWQIFVFYYIVILSKLKQLLKFIFIFIIKNIMYKLYILDKLKESLDLDDANNDDDWVNWNWIHKYINTYKDFLK